MKRYHHRILYSPAYAGRESLFSKAITMMALLLTLNSPLLANNNGKLSLLNHADDDMVVYSVSKPVDNGNDIEVPSSTNQPFSQKHSANVLNTLLERSKNEQNTFYLNRAFAYYEGLNDITKFTSEVQWAVAKLYGYTHQFEKASEALTLLTDDLQYRQAAHLELFNNAVLVGQYEKAIEHCQALKHFADPSIGFVCEQWLHNLLHKDEQSLKNLVSLANANHKNHPLRTWLNDVLVDVYLNMQQPIMAVSLLPEIIQTNNPDPAALLQIVDYYLVTNEFSKANNLLRNYDLHERFWLRTAISEKKSIEQLSDEQKWSLSVLKGTVNPEQAFPLSIWLLRNESDEDQATAIAELNYSVYQRQNNQLLMQAVSGSSNQAGV